MITWGTAIDGKMSCPEREPSPSKRKAEPSRMVNSEQHIFFHKCQKVAGLLEHGEMCPNWATLWCQGKQHTANSKGRTTDLLQSYFSAFGALGG